MGIAKEDLIKALSNAFETGENENGTKDRLVTESTRCDGHNYASLIKLHDREDFEKQAYAEHQDAYMIKDIINCLKEERGKQYAEAADTLSRKFLNAVECKDEMRVKSLTESAREFSLKLRCTSKDSPQRSVVLLYIANQIPSL
ncbi:MAG: hypothetical protein K6E95_07420 [Lachnospiraceae bacterium]|nr:hypothetical protein [Lachnospiraceae bacterium]